ncbi:MAG: methylmalonyl-CoA mutase family protein, partial [Aggregatilineaceae bacterium]
FRRIEELGGVLACVENGFFQQEIADSAHRFQREVDAGQRTIVGVNAFQSDEPLRIPLLEMDPQGYARQVARLAALRESRDAAAVERALDGLRRAAQGTENVMPHLLAAARAYATLGEIMDTLREVFGVYREPLIV